MKLGYDEYENAKGEELDAAVDAAMRCPHGISNADLCWACNPNRRSGE